MAEQIVPVKTYVVTYVALMLLLALTIGMSFVDIGQASNLAIAIGIAAIKALLVVLFFMHVKYASKLTWFFALAGIVWWMILLVLSMGDYITRNHPPNFSPKGEPTFLQRSS